MRSLRIRMAGWFCALVFIAPIAPSLASTVTVESTATGPVKLGETVWFVGKVDGKGIYMNFAVNGVPGGNTTVGTINSQNGTYKAPLAMPPGGYVTVTGTTTTSPPLSGSTMLTFTTGSTTTTPPPPTTPPPTTTTSPPPVVIAPPLDPATIAAARFLEQASFGPTPVSIALVKQIGPSAWITQQLAMPASPLPITTDMNTLRRNWYTNMANGQDQLRQRMIFALSQIFVVSADKNPYANEMQPWLQTLSANAFGNFGTLLREMSLNPSMGKYLDMANSALPEPNENYAREVMQLFTVGPVLLNQDGTPQLDGNGMAIPTYNQARISDVAKALSGWTYPGPNATGLNWENFAGPLQPRDLYHDKSSKTLLSDVVLRSNQTAQQDFDAVMDNLFRHPNVGPFIATRLIRALVTSNPSPAYVQRVAAVFNSSAKGRGDLAATVRAVLLDPEARQDTPTSTQGKLKDPILQSLGLVRALGGTVIDPSNLFWNYYLLGEQLMSAPSVFSFFSPMTRLPDQPQYYGPEFQIYAPSLAVARANFMLDFISGNFNSMIRVDITPFVNAAGNIGNLVNMVDATLLQGRMSPATRQTVANALAASTDNRQRAITALYLAAATAEFAVQK
jgi:hypothetical protein